MCETQSIRYVHHMEHPDYGSVLGVGKVCAGHMEEDYRAAQEREKQAKSIADRRTRWMNAQWKESQQGNSYINRNGFNVDSFVERPVRDGPWSARVSGREAPRAVGC